jgi:WD40 repeat protein
MQLHSIIYDHSNIIRSISSDRNIVASGGEDNTVYLNDVSDPSSITQLSTLTDHTAIVRAVELKGDVLATGGEDNIIFVYDISDPTTPALKATLTDPTNNVSSLSIYDNALFVGSTDSNVYVYDIANLDSVSLINTETQSAGVLSLSAKSVTQTDGSEAEVLAVGLTGGNTELYDIATKTGFVSLETKTDHTADVNSVSIGDSGLATGSTDNDIRIYDLTNVSSLIPNRYTIDDYTDSVFDVEISNNLLVAGGRDNYVRIYNILDLGNPIVLDEDNVHADWVYAVSITKDILSTGSRDYTVRVNDVSGYANLLGLTASLKAIFPDKGFPDMRIDRDRFEKFIDIPSEVSTISWNENAYSMDGTLLSYGLGSETPIFDISDPSNPKFLSIINYHTSQVRCVHIEDNILVSGASDYTVRIFDISNPLSPSYLLGIEDFTDRVYSLYVKNNILVTGCYDEIIRIYDISNPSVKNLLSTIDNEVSTNRDIKIKDNLLFVSSNKGNVKIFDISDPSNPVFVSNVEVNNSDSLVQSIFIKDNLLVFGAMPFTTDWEQVNIYDISDPSNPILLSEIGIGNSAITSIFIENNLMVVGNNERNVKIFDISDPSNPVLIGILDKDDIFDGHVHFNFIKGAYLFLGTHLEKVKIYNIYDIINGSDLQEINYYLNDNLIKTVTSDFIKVHELNFTEEEAEYLTNGRNFLDVELIDQSGVSDKTTLAIIAEVYEKPYPGNSILIKDTEYKVTDLSSTRDDYTVTLDKPLETNLIADESEIELTNLRFKPEVFVTDDPDYTPSQDEYLPMEYKSTQYEEEDVFGNQEKAVDEFQLQGTDVTGRYAHFKITGERTNYNDGVNIEGGERFGGMVLEKTEDIHEAGVNNNFTLFIKNNLLISSDQSVTKLYDVSDLSNITLLSTINDYGFYFYNDHNQIDLDKSPDNIYCSLKQNIDGDHDAVGIFDISDPSDPVLVGEINESSNIETLSVDYSEQLLILNGYFSSQYQIKLYDISDPSNPVLSSTLTEHSGYCYSLFIEKNLLITGSQDNTVKLFDISDPSNPILLSSELCNNTINALYKSGDTIAIGIHGGYLKLIDVSDLNNPTVLFVDYIDMNYTRTYNKIRDIIISGNALIMTGYSYNKVVYDIYDRENPELLSSFKNQDVDGTSMCINDEYLFLSKYSNGQVDIYSGLRSEFVINRPWISRPRSIFRFKEDIT